jgi:hypothetical protein
VWHQRNLREMTLRFFYVPRLRLPHVLLLTWASLLLSACATPAPSAPPVSATQLIQAKGLTSLVCNSAYATGLAPVYVHFHVNRRQVSIRQEFDNPSWGVDPVSTDKSVYYFVVKRSRVAWNISDPRTQETELVQFYPETMQIWFSEHHEHLLLKNGTWRPSRRGIHIVTPNVYGPGWSNARYDCAR